MENGIETGNDKIIKIVLTGPECTAKSTLAGQLAAHYKTTYVPEYARDYVLSLGRPYTYEDVEHIAGVQLKQFVESEKNANKLIFFDTYLVITKVWFDVVYHRHPAWIETELRKRNVHLYLLCDIDIPWIPDGVRENGGIMRERLFNVYRNEIEQFGACYRIVKGTGTVRLQSAIEAVSSLLDGMDRIKSDQYG